MKIPFPSEKNLVYGEDWRSRSAKVCSDDCKTTVLPRAVPKICFAFGKRLGKSVGFWLLFSVRLKSYRKFTHKNKSKLMQHDATRKSEDTRLGEIAWSLQVTSEHLQSPTIALNGIQLAWLAVQPSGSETEVLSFPQIGCLVTGHGQPISDDPSPPTQRRRSHLVSPAEALMDGLCHPFLVHLGWSAGVIMNS